jgi:hypothetical protein
MALAGIAGVCEAVTLDVTTETPAQATDVATTVVAPQRDQLRTRRFTKIG